MQLGKNINITRVISATEGAAASTDLASGIINMAGWDGVLFLISMGAITSGAVTTVKAQQDTAAAMGTAADLLGTSIAIAADDDDELFGLDIYKPLEQYVRVYFDRATQNAVISSVIAVQYKGAKAPIAQVAGASGGITLECHVSPAEGTA